MVVTTWFRTVCKVSRTCFTVARSSRYSVNKTLYMSSSVVVNEVVDDLAGLTSFAVGFSGRLGIAGSFSRSGLMYFQTSPPSAIDLTTKIQESQWEGRSRMTVLVVVAMVIGQVYRSITDAVVFDRIGGMNKCISV